MTLDDLWPYLNSVKKVSIYRNPKEPVDLTHKDRYEVISISGMYSKPGLDVKVKHVNNS